MEHRSVALLRLRRIAPLVAELGILLLASRDALDGARCLGIHAIFYRKIFQRVSDPLCLDVTTS